MRQSIASSLLLVACGGSSGLLDESGAPTPGAGGTHAAAGGSTTTPEGPSPGVGPGSGGTSSTPSYLGCGVDRGALRTGPPLRQADAGSCADDEVGIALTVTREEVMALLVGRWQSCTASSIFGTAEVGIDFGADGRWHKLFEQTGGELVRATAGDDHGRYELLEHFEGNPPGSFQLNLTSGSGLGISTFPVFATYPAKLRLDNLGIHQTDYVRTTPHPIPVVEAFPPPVPVRTLPDVSGIGRTRQQCEQLSTLSGPPDAAAFCGAIDGVWLSCGGSVFGTEEVGIELALEGQWYKLYVDPSGQLVRRSGFDDAGWWEASDWSAANGRPTYGLSFHIHGSGEVITTPLFGSDPAAMNLDNMAVFRSAYVRAVP